MGLISKKIKGIHIKIGKSCELKFLMVMIEDISSRQKVNVIAIMMENILAITKYLVEVGYFVCVFYIIVRCDTE